MQTEEKKFIFWSRKNMTTNNNKGWRIIFAAETMKQLGIEWCQIIMHFNEFQKQKTREQLQYQ